KQLEQAVFRPDELGGICGRFARAGLVNPFTKTLESPGCGNHDAGGYMGRAKVSCEDCYFKRAGLCALTLESPCPTFRRQTKNAPVPPQQASLVPRALVAQHHAA